MELLDDDGSPTQLDPEGLSQLDLVHENLALRNALVKLLVAVEAEDGVEEGAIFARQVLQRFAAEIVETLPRKR